MARRKQPSLRQTLYSGFTPLGPGSVGQRASAEAQLRYAPQIESLLMLLGQRRLQQRQDVQQVRRGGLAAAGGIGQVRSGFQQQLADTPAPTSQAAAHLGLTRDAVSGALAQMQAQQYAGINAGVSNARRSSRTDQVNILQQLSQAAQQGGLYNASEFNALSDAAHKFRAQQNQANATLMAGLAKAGLGPDGKPIPGIFNRIHPGKTPHAPVDGVDYQTYLQMSPAQRRAAHRLYGAAGRKPGSATKSKAAPGTAGAASQSDYSKYQNDFSKAQQLIQYIPHGMSDVEAVQFIQAGIPKTTNTAGVKGVDDQAAAWAAWEMHRYKGVSDYVAGLLHQRGLKVRTLRYPHFTPPRKSHGLDIRGTLGPVKRVP